MATVTADVVTWQDTAVKTGSTYTYRIRASYVRSGKNTVYGAASPPLAAKAELGKARAVAEAVSGPCNRVSWKKVSGASGYHIYRKLQGKSWVRIGTVNNKVLSWKDTEIEGITSYAYAVRPYKKVDGKKVLGGYQASSYILSYPELQKISCVRKTSRGLKICWKAQKKADCYQIYRKTGKGSWKKISTVSGGSSSSFEDKTAKKGTTYYYAVRAGIKTSGGKGEPFRKAVIVGQRGIIGIVRTCPHAEVRPLVGEGRFGVHLNQSAHGIAPVERALRTA